MTDSSSKASTRETPSDEAAHHAASAHAASTDRKSVV